jgi:hypothetical protein
MNMQALIDGLGSQWQRERSATQMTLGALIAALEAMPEGAMVANLADEHSYRGYYDDLAFEHFDGLRPTVELLADCRTAMGKVYQGYKGGDFRMHAMTPVWVASYGCCGQKIMRLGVDGDIELADDDE